MIYLQVSVACPFNCIREGTHLNFCYFTITNLAYLYKTVMNISQCFVAFLYEEETKLQCVPNERRLQAFRQRIC